MVPFGILHYTSFIEFYVFFVCLFVCVSDGSTGTPCRMLTVSPRVVSCGKVLLLVVSVPQFPTPPSLSSITSGDVTLSHFSHLLVNGSTIPAGPQAIHPLAFPTLSLQLFPVQPLQYL